jgi:two-component system response regulator YesN
LRTGSQEDAVAIAQALQRFLCADGKVKARLCFSRCAAQAQELPVLYAQVMQFEKYSQYLGDVDILGSGYRCSEEEFHKARYAEYGRQATEALRRHDTVGALRILEEALRNSTAISPHDLSSIYEFCFQIVLCAKGLLAEGRTSPGNGQGAWIAEIRYRQISALCSLEELRGFMTRVVRALSPLPQEKTDQYSQLVREGMDFLATRYDQNISLDEICRHLTISKNYFSYLFKRDTGVSLWAYLTGVRMRRAKALLRDTSLKSLEIAYQIGYDNPSYFSKLFKKLNGQTPNEYRTSVRKE